MSISSEQAQQTLRDLESVGRRSGELYRYSRVAPMLMLWGVIWFVGFAASAYFPARTNWIWLVLDAIGIGGSIVLGRRGRDDAASRQSSWRWLAAIGSVMGLYAALLFLFQPATLNQSAATIALIIAFCYVIYGIWAGVRVLITGIALAALTLFGYVELAAHFELWMAVVCGGALVLAGFWMRRA
jgi:hypothetical protein